MIRSAAIAFCLLAGICDDLYAIDLGQTGHPETRLSESERANHSRRALTFPARGTITLPVVLALFKDSPDPHIDPASVRRALFDGPATRGTLTEVYLEMSSGKFRLDGDVLDWVRTSLPIADVVGNRNGLGGTNQVADYLTEALALVDPGVDFSSYDNDGPDGIANSGDDDGLVDAVAFEYLELSSHCGGPSIWPHRWSLTGVAGSAFTTDDLRPDGSAIQIDDYIIQPATDCTGLQVQDASIIAHEFGHVLGLPDYYDWVDREAGADGRRWVLGCFSLMAAGIWGCGDITQPPQPFGPTHLDAPSKHQLGWIEYLDPGEVWYEEIVLDPVQNSHSALRIPLELTGTEFLVAEYRSRLGFDTSLPADGVLFYHQDLLGSLSPDSDEPYRLALIERDAGGQLQRTRYEGGNAGEASDVWGADGATHQLHGETNPPLAVHRGQGTTVTIHEVTVIDQQARLIVSTGVVPRIVFQGSGSGFETARIAGGIMPYIIKGEMPSGAEIRVSGDRLNLTGTGSLDTLFLWLEDASQNLSNALVAVPELSEWQPSSQDLLAPFLFPSGSDLPTTQQRYLDAAGNDNGSYDVGDLRRWLR